MVGLDSLISVGGMNIISDSLESLKGLQSLSKINGFLRIDARYLKSIDELANVKKIKGSLILENNLFLDNLEGLSQIDTLSGITMWGNKNLHDFDDLESLKYVGGIFLSGTNITNLKFFQKIENAQPTIYIGANDTLMNLEGLEHFDTLGSLTLGANDKLNDVSAIKDVDYIKGDLIVEFNKQLGNCCIIRHLLSGGGRVGGRISLGGNKNGSSCQDVIQLSRCPTEPVSPCESIGTIATLEYIGIGNLTAPIEILKVFDSNYNIVYECFADCEENIQIRDLPAGVYHININLYDTNWQPICEYNRSIEFTGNAQDRSLGFVATDFPLYPNPVKTETFIDLSKIKGEAVTLNLYNQFGQQVWTNHIEQIQQNRERIDLSNFQNGLYFLKIHTESRKLVAKKLMISRLY